MVFEFNGVNIAHKKKMEGKMKKVLDIFEKMSMILLND